ncbi:MAG: hypothetical protein ABI599_15270 [Flavobacteriales bacterium]
MTLNNTSLPTPPRRRRAAAVAGLNRKIAGVKLAYWIVAVLLSITGYAVTKETKDVSFKYEDHDGEGDTAIEFQYKQAVTGIADSVEAQKDEIDVLLADTALSFDAKKKLTAYESRLTGIADQARLILAEGERWPDLQPHERKLLWGTVLDFFKDAAQNTSSAGWKAMLADIDMKTMNDSLAHFKGRLASTQAALQRVTAAFAAAQAASGAERTRLLAKAQELRDSVTTALASENSMRGSLGELQVAYDANSTKLNAVQPFRISDEAFFPGKLKGDKENFKLAALKNGFNVKFKLAGVADWVKSDSVLIRIEVKMIDGRGAHGVQHFEDLQYMSVGKRWDRPYTLDNIRTQVPGYTWGKGVYILSVFEASSVESFYTGTFTVGGK